MCTLCTPFILPSCIQHWEIQSSYMVHLYSPQYSHSGDDGCVAVICLSSDPAVVSKCAMFTIFSQITNFKFHDKYDNTTNDYINGYIKLSFLFQSVNVYIKPF